MTPAEDNYKWRAIVYYEEDIPPNTDADFQGYDGCWIYFYVCTGNKLVENASLAYAEQVSDRNQFKKQIRQARLEARRNAAIAYIQSTLQFEREASNPHHLNPPAHLQEKLIQLPLDQLEELSIDVLWLELVIQTYSR